MNVASGLRLRPFAGDADFPPMADVANANFAANGIPAPHTKRNAVYRKPLVLATPAGQFRGPGFAMEPCVRQQLPAASMEE
jgi:hypothetical protein